MTLTPCQHEQPVFCACLSGAVGEEGKEKQRLSFNCLETNLLQQILQLFIHLSCLVHTFPVPTGGCAPSRSEVKAFFTSCYFFKWVEGGQKKIADYVLVKGK